MTMKTLKLFVMFLTLVALVACEPPQEITNYPPMESVADTEWYYSEMKDGESLFYTLNFEGTSEGSLVCSNKKEGGDILSEETFTYVYNKNGHFDIAIDFEQQGNYAGYMTGKGDIMIDFKPAYIIQLFAVDEEGNILKDVNGNYLSTKQFWHF